MMITLTSAPRMMLSCEMASLTQCRSMGRRAPKQGKPPILPPSKKVLYHVVHVPWQKPEDVKELLWRRNVYNSTVESLRQVFREELEKKATAGVGIDSMREAEEEEFNQLIRQNQENNKRKAEARAEDEKEEWKAAQLEILKDIEDSLQKQRQLSASATEEVRAAIERSKNFVTKENLDEKILAALENPVVYDFAINRQGEKFYDPVPVKYQEGTPTRQKGRLYDRTLGGPQNTSNLPPIEESAVENSSN